MLQANLVCVEIVLRLQENIMDALTYLPLVVQS